MKISLNWLRDYVEIPKSINPRELAEKLSLHVVEVEGFEHEAELFEHMVVGKVVSIEKHPNADKLSVCTVDAGIAGTKLNIVCGGKNVREGVLVAVALPGSKVKWHGEGELVELKETAVRGVKSYGMICAGGEIGLDEVQARQTIVGDGLQILDISNTRAKPGTPIAQALGKEDVVFEISNVSLSNRPDLWSHVGIARELSTLFNKPLRLPNVSNQELRMRDKGKELSVQVVDKNLCARYIGVLIENVHIAITLEWIRKRLMAVGQRPIHPLVDISNYVMFELGQPVHIFDAAKIAESRGTTRGIARTIVVRKAKRGEKIKTLDGVERELDETMLVIADAREPVAIAGVMGGENSGVSEHTHSIVVECATFEPISIRKTSGKLGVKTDASQRFEKSLDPHLPAYAAVRVRQLLRACADKGTTPDVRSAVDVSSKISAPKPIRLPLEALNRRIGTPVPRARAKKILLGLGFTVRGTAKEWRVTPPSWRATRDVSLPEDIIEEIGRHLDYNTIPDALPAFSIAPPPVSAHYQLERALKPFLAGAGFYEVEHKPFINPSEWHGFGLEREDHVEIINPIDPSARYMRQSLLPGLFSDLRLNRGGMDALRLYEWGRVFFAQGGGDAVKRGVDQRVPHQPVTLSLVSCEETDAEEMLRRVKGTAQEALRAAGYLVEVKTVAAAVSLYHAGTAFSLFVQGAHAGEGGVASEALKVALGLLSKSSVGIATIVVDALAGLTPSVPTYMPLPEYPAVQRDLAIVVEEGVAYDEIKKSVRNAAGPLLTSLALFDVFRGKGIPQGKKSLALRLIFRAQDRTLKSAEIDDCMHAIADALAHAWAGVVR